MRVLALILLCFVFVTSVAGQSKFYKLYSGSGYDIGKGVIEYPDSSFLVTGSTTSWGGGSQVYLLKIDSTGTYQWSYQYGGSEYDDANRVLFNSDLGIYTIGSTNSIGAGDYNGLVIHTDAAGNELWKKSYGSSEAWEFLNDAVFSKDTSIIMVGSSRPVSSGNEYIYMLSINNGGDTLWTKTLNEWESSSALSVIRVEDSLFVVAGYFYEQDSLVQKGFLMKINSNGEEIWSRTVGPLSGKYALHDVALGDGDFYALGSREINEYNHDLYRARFDFNGNPIVEKTDIDNSEIRDEIGDEIIYMPSLNNTLLGYRSINEFTFQDDYDVYFSFYTPQTLVWMNNFSTINNAGLDQVRQLSATSDGGFIAVGQTTYPMSGGSNIFIFKGGTDGSFPNAADYYTIDTLVNLNENQDDLFVCYPNPSSGVFHLRAKQGLSKELRVYNSLGQQILIKSIEGMGLLDLNSFPDGMYYAKTEGLTFKLMKTSL